MGAKWAPLLFLCPSEVTKTDYGYSTQWPGLAFATLSRPVVPQWLVASSPFPSWDLPAAPTHTSLRFTVHIRPIHVGLFMFHVAEIEF